MSVKARHGTSYLLTFIDDYTRYGYIYLIAHRYEALDCFKRFIAEVENQTEKSLKALRTDSEREYLSEQFKELCENKGIRRQLTVPYTPEQNGVAKRRNRTLLDMVRSLMAQANLPISFWGEAILTAVYILNQVPSQSVTSAPYELWKGEKPNLRHLRPWGSAGFVHNTFHKHGKLGSRENDFPSIGDAQKNLDLLELEGSCKKDKRIAVENISLYFLIMKYTIGCHSYTINS
ncbi:unnamed protein product [Prunus armeniaca]